MRQHSLITFSVVAAVLLGASFSGTIAGQLGCSPAQGAIPQAITVFYSNETENELYRCGCTGNQKGGLSRRASVIAQQEANPSLLVDAGNFSAKRPGNDYDETKSTYLLQVYNMLGYSALNVGPMEFNRGKAKLLDLAERTEDLLISANVTDAEGELVLPPYRIAEIEGLRVGIIGLITEQFKPNPDDPADALTTLDPIEAFDKVWDEVNKKSDIQILLSQLRDDEVELLTKSYPEIDLVVGGPGWRQGAEMQPWKVNEVPAVKVGVRGQYFGQVELNLDATDRRNVKVAEVSGSVVELSAAIPDNTEVEKVLEQFKEQMRTGAVVQDIFEAHTADAQFGYAGSIYCQECHGGIYAGWLRTRHAQAFQTLAQKGEHNNPGCLECHTVGYGEPGGYASKGNSYLLANVQCENCHGPASDHMVVAQEYKEGKMLTPPTDWKIAMTTTPASTCIQCHNPDNDPHWQDGVWPYEMMVEQVACSQWLPSGTPATGHEGHLHAAPGTTTPEPAVGDNAPPPAEGTPKPGTTSNH